MFGFGKKPLSSDDRKRIFGAALALAKQANGTMPTLRSLLGDAGNINGDSSTVTDLLNDFKSYGMRGAAMTDPSAFWDGADRSTQISAIEMTLKCV